MGGRWELENRGFVKDREGVLKKEKYNTWPWGPFAEACLVTHGPGVHVAPVSSYARQNRSFSVGAALINVRRFHFASGSRTIATVASPPSGQHSHLVTRRSARGSWSAGEILVGQGDSPPYRNARSSREAIVVCEANELPSSLFGFGSDGPSD